MDGQSAGVASVLISRLEHPNPAVVSLRDVQVSTDHQIPSEGFDIDADVPCRSFGYCCFLCSFLAVVLDELSGVLFDAAPMSEVDVLEVRKSCSVIFYNLSPRREVQVVFLDARRYLARVPE